MAYDGRMKERKNKEENIINNILNSDSYRFKSNMFSGNNEVFKNNQGNH